MCGKPAVCYDMPSSALPGPKEEKSMPKREAEKKAPPEPVKLTPVDEERCQCERPNGATFMTFGASPKLVRCKNRPIVIATEKTITHKDGQQGAMSLCAHCMNKLVDQMGADFATFRAIEREGEDKGV